MHRHCRQRRVNASVGSLAQSELDVRRRVDPMPKLWSEQAEPAEQRGPGEVSEAGLLTGLMT